MLHNSLHTHTENTRLYRLVTILLMWNNVQTFNSNNTAHTIVMMHSNYIAPMFTHAYYDYHYHNVMWCQKWDKMAAGYQASLQPPQPFRFDTPDEWPKWRHRFEQFRMATGLSKEDEERQVSTLLYCLGEEADDVLTSTNISTEIERNIWKFLINSMPTSRCERM